MRLFCCAAAEASPAERYVLEFMLHSRGYFFTWIDQPARTEPGNILLLYAGTLPDIPPNTTTVWIPRRTKSDLPDSGDPDWETVMIGNREIPIIASTMLPEPVDVVNCYPFDSVANMFYHLSRYEEKSFSHPDDVDRRLEDAILYKNGSFMLPVVDILCRDLGAFIERIAQELDGFRIRKAAYPNGEDFGVVLTHDVDIVRAYHPLKKTFLKLLIILGIKKNLTASQLDLQDRTLWAFDRLIGDYREKGIRATFFFIARYTEQFHFRYRIFSRTFRRLFETLKKQGHEIGLHPSRFAFEHPDRYGKELRRLRKAAGTEIYGMRHHYLRCLFPRIWRTAAELGLAYDATLGYRRHHGFRSGTTLPFRAVDHAGGTVPDLTVFPLNFFEESLPAMGSETGEAMKAIEALISAVRDSGGLLTVLWHPGNLYRGNSFEEIWNGLLSRIRQEKVYRVPLIDHLRWIDFRNNLQPASWERTGNQLKVVLECPGPGREFSLELSGHPVVLRIENARMKWLDEHILQIQPSANVNQITLHFRVNDEQP